MMTSHILAAIHVLARTLHAKHWSSRPAFIAKAYKSGIANWFAECIWPELRPAFPNVPEIPLASAALLSLFGPESKTPPPVVLFDELHARFGKFARRVPAGARQAWLVEFALAYSAGWERRAISHAREWDARRLALGFMAFHELVVRSADDVFDVVERLTNCKRDRRDLPGLGWHMATQIADWSMLPDGAPDYAFLRLLRAWEPERGGHLYGFILVAVAGGPIVTSARGDCYILANQFRNGWLFMHERAAARFRVEDVALEQAAADPNGEWRPYNGGESEGLTRPIDCIVRGEMRILAERDPQHPLAMLRGQFWRCGNEVSGRHFFEHFRRACPRCGIGRSGRTTSLWVPARFASFAAGADDVFTDADRCHEIALEQPADEPDAAKTDYGFHLRAKTSAVVYAGHRCLATDNGVDRVPLPFARCCGHHFDYWLERCPRCGKPGTGEWDPLMVSFSVIAQHRSNPGVRRALRVIYPD